MSLPIGIVADLERVTRYPVSTFLTNVSTFIDRERGDVIDYYSGTVESPNEASFKKMSDLIAESIRIEGLIQIHGGFVLASGLVQKIANVVMRDGWATCSAKPRDCFVGSIRFDQRRS